MILVLLMVQSMCTCFSSQHTAVANSNIRDHSNDNLRYPRSNAFVGVLKRILQKVNTLVQSKDFFNLNKNCNRKQIYIFTFHTEYYMPKSVSHAVSTQDSYVNPLRDIRPQGNISKGLISHQIQILTCHVH